MAHNQAPPTLVKAYSMAAYLAVVQGDLNDAADLLQSAADALGSDFTGPSAAAWLRTAQAVLARARGQHDLALEFVEQAMDALAAEQLPPPGILLVLRTSALIQLGELDTCTPLLEEHLRALTLAGDSYAASLTEYNRAVIAMLRGDCAGASAALQDGMRLVTQMGEPIPIPTWLEALAALAAMMGDARRSATLLGGSAAMCERLGLPAPEAPQAAPQRLLPTGMQVPDLIAQTRSRLGDEAFAACWSAGKELTLEQIVHCALDASSALPQPVMHLTPREREVLALLTRGYTNRQIAETLIVGVRTAETHVERILRKLNLANRTEALLWATGRAQSVAA
jgi:ATP/maltotriose-dependent transcriptional regulator MalT